MFYSCLKIYDSAIFSRKPQTYCFLVVQLYIYPKTNILQNPMRTATISDSSTIADDGPSYIVIADRTNWQNFQPLYINPREYTIRHSVSFSLTMLINSRVSSAAHHHQTGSTRCAFLLAIILDSRFRARGKDLTCWTRYRARNSSRRLCTSHRVCTRECYSKLSWMMGYYCHYLASAARIRCLYTRELCRRVYMFGQPRTK